MRSITYWKNRANEREALTNRLAAEAQQSLSEAYRKAYNDIDGEVKKLFSRYAKDNSLTLKEAERFLSAHEIERWSAELRSQISTIADTRLKQEFQSRLDDALAMRHRVSRLESIQTSVDVRMAALAEREYATDTKALMDVVDGEYHRHIFDMQKGSGAGFAFTSLDTGATREILSQNWSGKQYSERIWENVYGVNRDSLATDIKKILTAGLETGRGYDAMTREIMERFGTGYYEARRLIHTEASAMHNMADLKVYEETGIEHVRFVATLDSRTSEICQEMDGRKIAVKSLQQGKNLPPLHPFCRSTTVAYIDESVTAEWKRSAKDPKTGKSILVPYNMTYKEWKKKYAA